ncbi:MAG TPA: lipocalin-like domain-containing protein [Candidatus Methylomirabilis sp.]|nr:lipocalin-like domain-containing protein [Candidatus Methylomirabilis sp.]
MSKGGRTAVAVALALAALVLGTFAWQPIGKSAPPDHVPRAAIAVTDALGAGDQARFARALGPRLFVFPADHGPHPEFRTEWWYYTGNLETATGRHVGFQLTFFRVALAPPEPAGSVRRASAWGADQLYLAHFALTDTAGGRFHGSSRTSRAALGLAGARAFPFRVWVGDWSAESDAQGALPVRLRASDADLAIDLVLESGKSVALQGDRGWSRKGAGPGNASYYYSLTRMPARGRVTVRGESLAVSGLAWMDREWSTTALAPELAGWDWLALQLDDGRDVMVYQLRRRDGSADPHSAGTLVAADGTTRPLARDEVGLAVLDHWTSPASQVRYPSRWRLAIPGADLRLEIAPRLADQELIVGTRYWEGAVEVHGSESGRPISGRGYVELVGYGE